MANQADQPDIIARLDRLTRDATSGLHRMPLNSRHNLRQVLFERPVLAMPPAGLSCLTIPASQQDQPQSSARAVEAAVNSGPNGFTPRDDLNEVILLPEFFNRMKNMNYLSIGVVMAEIPVVATAWSKVHLMAPKLRNAITAVFMAEYIVFIFVVFCFLTKWHDCRTHGELRQKMFMLQLWATIGAVLAVLCAIGMGLVAKTIDIWGVWLILALKIMATCAAIALAIIFRGWVYNTRTTN